MNEGVLVFFLVAGILYVVISRSWHRRRDKHEQRNILLNTPLPEEWRTHLEANVPLYQRLPDDLKQQVDGHIQIMLDEIIFEGHGGLEMSDEIRVTIAGQASFLLLNQKEWFPDTLRTIIVYPGAYKARTTQASVGGIHAESEQTVLGQSWDAGLIILSWDNTRHSVANPNDGHNLVLHEFAHQLDQATGTTDGAPVLQSRSSHRKWWQTMSRVYSDFIKDLDRGHKTVMNHYGATHPAEFFAVATETFFEKPRQLKNCRPELYDELCKYYRTEPLVWSGTKNPTRRL